MYMYLYIKAKNQATNFLKETKMEMILIEIQMIIITLKKKETRKKDGKNR